jgi:hypothetical protein
METWRFFQVYGLLEFRLTNLSTLETGVVRRYIVTLQALEQAVPAAAANLDTDQASMWTRNKSEVADRMHLFDEWRRRLCGFLGVPSGSALASAAPTLIV